MNENYLDRIKELKKEKDVTILAHNYQLPEIQDIADFLGDSLELAKKATKVSSKYILFCGVNFMAESVKILNPDKIVIHPDLDSRCPMADMVDVDSLLALKKDHPDSVVVSYVNTTAKVKAVSDIVCTSANAVDIVKSIDSDKIIFVPDINLGSYIKRFVMDKEIIIWPGFCYTHYQISREDILSLKRDHPNAEIVVHPECRPEVIDIADRVFSTGGMVKYAKLSPAREFIIGTERDMTYRLEKENPNKRFYSISHAICRDMKKITVSKVLRSLETLEPRLELPDNIIKRAKIPLERMMNTKT